MDKEPINDNLLFDFDFLDKVIVGIGEVSEITGVPTRKIRYWEKKGIIQSTTESGKNRRFDYKNIKKILLMKELLDEGYTLKAASEKVKNRIEMINKALAKLKDQKES